MKRLSTRALSSAALVLTLVAVTLSNAITASASSGVTGAANSSMNRKTKLLRAIVLNMGTDSPTVTDPQYDKYFKNGSALNGVEAIIASGRFSINGYAIPANQTIFTRDDPNGYLVNQVPWLYYDASAKTWKGGFEGEATAPSYAAAALAVATAIPAGLEVRLYDRNRDGYADRIDADYHEGVSINKITRNRNNTYSVYRGDVDTANRTEFEGRAFDGTHFTATSCEVIKAANFDRRVKVGDIALFWYGPDGWVITRAKQVKGIFVTGTDHQSYNIDGVDYQDAMRFSRDNVFISNRPGEFANAQKYFGLNNNSERLSVSLWLVPTTDPNAQGAPIALTSNASARPFLKKAVTEASEKLASVTVSADGTDVPESQKWVTQPVYTQLDNAIKRAKAAEASLRSSASLLDYQIYLLYLTLNGSSQDIGARFAGFTYAGFDNQIELGTMTSS